VILITIKSETRSIRNKSFNPPKPSLWRYTPLLAVQDPDFSELRSFCGWTPVYYEPQLAAKIGIRNLWIKEKDEIRPHLLKIEPVHSDRPSKRNKCQKIVTASTEMRERFGGMAAASGWHAIIFAPKSAPPAKIAQLLVFGAEVILVDGNYDSAFDLSISAAERYGWYCRNTGYNAFTAEGKKTAAFEIWEQIISKQNGTSAPLNVFVSVGDGNIISGIHKDSYDLKELGWLPQMPTHFRSQSEKSSAVYQAWAKGSEEIIQFRRQHLPISISVDLPRDV
jgi:threonine synthase